jgi:predicted Zn-dependent peptidase
MYQTIYGQLYYNYPLKNDILGDENDLYDISLQDIERVYKHFYHLNNTTLFIMGDIDINNMIEILENVNLPKDYYDIKRLSIDEPKVVKNSILTKEFDIEVPLLFVGYKYNISHLNMKERIKLEVMFIILTQLILGNHIEFVDNLIKNELIFDGFDFEHVVEGEYLTVLIYNQTINSELLFQRLHKYLSNDAIKEISEERLDILKKSYLGTLIVVNDDFETRLHILTKFYKDGILMEQMVELIQSITYDEMIKLFETFNEMPYSVLYAHSKKHENILD